MRNVYYVGRDFFFGSKFTAVESLWLGPRGCGTAMTPYRRIDVSALWSGTAAKCVTRPQLIHVSGIADYGYLLWWGGFLVSPRELDRRPKSRFLGAIHAPI